MIGLFYLFIYLRAHFNFTIKLRGFFFSFLFQIVQKNIFLLSQKLKMFLKLGQIRCIFLVFLLSFGGKSSSLFFKIPPPPRKINKPCLFYFLIRNFFIWFLYSEKVGSFFDGKITFASSTCLTKCQPCFSFVGQNNYFETKLFFFGIIHSFYFWLNSPFPM